VYVAYVRFTRVLKREVFSWLSSVRFEKEEETVAGRFAKHVKSKSKSDELPKEFKTRENAAIFAFIKRGTCSRSVKEVLIFAYIKIIWESYIHFSYLYWKKALEEAEKRSDLTPPLS